MLKYNIVSKNLGIFLNNYFAASADGTFVQKHNFLDSCTYNVDEYFVIKNV